MGSILDIFALEAVMYYYMPGVWNFGRPLRHEGGRSLPYYCSAYCSFYATLVIAAVLHFTRVFPLYTLIDEFGPIMSVAILSGFLNSFIVHTQAMMLGRTHRLSGSAIYSFFMGAELNPRIGILDFKKSYLRALRRTAIGARKSPMGPLQIEFSSDGCLSTGWYLGRDQKSV
jgi:delta24(24(1))-sterol reductase